MKSTDEIPPQARRVYFTGALAAVNRQLDHLGTEKERIEWELDRAKAELEEQATKVREKKGAAENENQG